VKLKGQRHEGRGNQEGRRHFAWWRRADRTQEEVSDAPRRLIHEGSAHQGQEVGRGTSILQPGWLHELNRGFHPKSSSFEDAPPNRAQRREHVKRFVNHYSRRTLFGFGRWRRRLAITTDAGRYDEPFAQEL
jgi:hypothetical protein